MEEEGPDRAAASTSSRPQGAMTDADWQAMDKEVLARDRGRGRVRRGQPVPDAGAGARRHVRGLSRTRMPCAELTYAQAVSRPSPRRCARIPRIFYMSTDPIPPLLEGIRRQARQGRRRSPRARMTGMAIGAAGSGYRPIVDWRQVTFSFVAMDQIVNQAAKIHYMFGGQRDFPILYPRRRRRRHAARGAALPEPVLDVHEPVRAEDDPALDAALT